MVIGVLGVDATKGKGRQMRAATGDWRVWVATAGVATFDLAHAMQQCHVQDARGTDTAPHSPVGASAHKSIHSRRGEAAGAYIRVPAPTRAATSDDASRTGFYPVRSDKQARAPSLPPPHSPHPPQTTRTEPLPPLVIAVTDTGIDVGVVGGSDGQS